MSSESDNPPTHVIRPEPIVLQSVVSSPTLTVHSPPKSDDPINALVGQVAVVTAHIEQVFDVIIWELIGASNSVGACITSELNGLFPRYAVIKKLLTEKHATAELLQQASNLKKVVGKASGLRNRLIHDPWYVQHGSHLPQSFHDQMKKKPDRSDTFGHTAQDLTDVQGSVDYQREALTQALSLRSAILKWQHADHA